MAKQYVVTARAKGVGERRLLFKYPVRVSLTLSSAPPSAGRCRRSWAGRRTALARVVRGKLLELRESDFVMAARLAGALDWAIIRRHLLPSFMSYLIVSLTLAVPGMILGETALSFLGLGLRPPVVSWGVLLPKAQNLRTVTLHSWLLIPAGFGCDRAGLHLPRRRPARRRRSLQVAGSAQQAQQRPGIGIELAPASTRCYPPVHRPWQQH